MISFKKMLILCTKKYVTKTIVPSNKKKRGKYILYNIKT